MEKVKFTYRAYDNILEIIPEDGIKDNSIYSLIFFGIKSEDHQYEIPKQTLEFTTAMKPCYCKLEDVKALIDVFEIPDSTIFYLIRQASKQADYINRGPIDISNGIPFEVEKYTQLKAALDAFTRAYIDGTSENGIEGTLGKITFKNGSSLSNIKTMIDQFRRDIRVWQDAIRGYHLEGRNKPTYAIRSNNIIYPVITTKEILSGYTRDKNFATSYYRPKGY